MVQEAGSLSVESCKISLLGSTSYSLVQTHFCCWIYRLVTMHNVTDRWTDSWSYLAPFRRYCTFCAPDPTPIPPWFLGVFPLHQITHVGVSPRIAIRPCNYFPRIPTSVITVPQRHRRTDRQTDGRTDNLLSHHSALR